MSIKTSQDTFNLIEQRYLATWCRLHPEAALDAGINDYADKLRAHDDDTISNTELKDFHDKLLASGSIALPLVIQHQFGENMWLKCCQHVFGEQP